MAVMFGVGRVEMRRGGTKCGTRCGGVSGDFYRPGRQVEVMGGARRRPADSGGV
jgi:hypothetical protein